MIALDELKVAIRHVLDPDDTTEDAFLIELEKRAVETIGAWTDRYFGEPADAIQYVRQGSGTPILHIPDRVSAISAVSSRAYLGGAETTILTGATDGWALRLQPGRIWGTELVRKGGSIWDPYLEYVITGAFGFEPGTEPGPIRQAVTELVAHWYGAGRQPVITGTIATEVPLTVRDLIAPFKRIPA